MLVRRTPARYPVQGKRMGGLGKPGRAGHPHGRMIRSCGQCLGVRNCRRREGVWENSVSCDRTSGAVLAVPDDVSVRRGTYFAKPLSVAIGAVTLLLIGSPIIARAATVEEVARCRAIQISSERWQCFKSLRAPKRNAPKAKRDDAPKVQREDAPKTVDVPKTEDVPADALGGKQETAPDDPASTSSINRLRTAPGQPVCVDQDLVAAALIAGMLASDPTQATTTGCQTLPDDAEVEVIQRIPSGFQFLRIVKVKVTSPSQPEPSVGYTIEISH